MKNTTKFCKDCGKIMWDVQPNKRYCDKCLHDKNLRYAQISYQCQKAQKEEKKRKKRTASLPCRPHSIAWCVREAEKHGMSYGRFVGLGLDKEAQA